ncbi:hypothetical protein HG530_013390 [Fusarium avenaceum]|nr:hypothetical protein HG530_013390 [Fusarium avenaceum]
MTEPENFEDDLFADLHAIILTRNSYDDNDGPKQTPAPAAPAPPAPEVQPPTNTQNDDHDLQNGTYQHQDTAGDEHMIQDQDDDDDDVDFNLGGGGGGGYGGAGHTGQGGMHDDAQTPPYGTVHKASAKEDGGFSPVSATLKRDGNCKFAA